MNVVARSAWNPKHGVGNRTPRPQSRVVIHHAPERTLPDRPTRAQVAEQIRIMEDWHAEKLTPSNPRIGYHWIAVEQTGEIWEGLGWDRVGAHVGGHNTASLGILVLGIDGARSAGGDRVWRAIGELVAEGIRRGSLVARPELSPHRRYVATSCPGDVLTRHVEQLTLDELLALAAPEPQVGIVDSDLSLALPTTPEPRRERAHPLRRRVTDVALPDETTAGFLSRVGGSAGEVLGPIGRVLWDRLLAMILARLEKAGEDAADRVFGGGR